MWRVVQQHQAPFIGQKTNPLLSHVEICYGPVALTWYLLEIPNVLSSFDINKPRMSEVGVSVGQRTGRHFRQFMLIYAS